MIRQRNRSDRDREDQTSKVVRSRPFRGPRSEDETIRISTRCDQHQGPRTDLPLRFGDWLVRRELISRHELYAALDRAYRRRDGHRLGDALVDLGVLARDCVEQEARAFLTFTTFTVSLGTHPPGAGRAADQVHGSLDRALAAVACDRPPL